jgi:hypothetical protein
MTIAGRAGSATATGWPALAEIRVRPMASRACHRTISLERGIPTCNPESRKESIRVTPAKSHWILRGAQDDRFWVRRRGRVAEALSLPRDAASRSHLPVRVRSGDKTPTKTAFPSQTTVQRIHFYVTGLESAGKHFIYEYRLGRHGLLADLENSRPGQLAEAATV